MRLFFTPTLVYDDPAYIFKGTNSISSYVSPGSMFYVVVTVLDRENKLYGPSVVYEYQIGESYVGKLIRSFGGSDSYYSSTLNVNGSNKTVSNIVSINSYSINDAPSQRGYDFYFNNVNKQDQNTYYFPIFENSSDFTDNDVDYIENHYYDNDIVNITENVVTNFDFNFGDISANDIQKMYDDTTDLIGVVGNLFSLVASLFGICFPFLLFDIPGWLLFIGGLFLVAAGVGLFMKIVSFFRG